MKNYTGKKKIDEKNLRKEMLIAECCGNVVNLCRIAVNREDDSDVVMLSTCLVYLCRLSANWRLFILVKCRSLTALLRFADKNDSAAILLFAFHSNYRFFFSFRIQKKTSPFAAPGPFAVK